MHIGPLGMPEIIIILVVVLLIFGPKNLPKLGKAIGRSVKSLRDGMDGEKDEAKAAKSEPAKSEPAKSEPAAAEVVADAVEAPEEKATKAE